MKFFLYGVILFLIFPLTVLAHATTITLGLYDSGSFDKEATIYKGEKILFSNFSRKIHQPVVIFDNGQDPRIEVWSDHPLAAGENWLYKFEQEGIWKYYDASDSAIAGTITVQVGQGLTSQNMAIQSRINEKKQSSFFESLKLFLEALFQKITHTR